MLHDGVARDDDFCDVGLFYVIALGERAEALVHLLGEDALNFRKRLGRRRRVGDARNYVVAVSDLRVEEGYLVELAASLEVEEVADDRSRADVHRYAVALCVWRPVGYFVGEAFEYAVPLRFDAVDDRHGAAAHDARAARKAHPGLDVRLAEHVLLRLADGRERVVRARFYAAFAADARAAAVAAYPHVRRVGGLGERRPRRDARRDAVGQEFYLAHCFIH